MRSALRVLAAAALLTASPALAAHWMVDEAQSALTFSGTQAGESFTGGFKKFTSEIEFDEAKPELGKIHVMVDMASAFADSNERSEALPSKDWFDVPRFATAEFTSTAIAKTAEHHYRATGNLRIRDVTKPLTLDFSLAPQGAQTLATGTAQLSRNDFNVGQGQWADEKWVAYPIRIQFRLVAKPRWPHH